MSILKDNNYIVLGIILIEILSICYQTWLFHRIHGKLHDFIAVQGTRAIATLPRHVNVGFSLQIWLSSSKTLSKLRDKKCVGFAQGFNIQVHKLHRPYTDEQFDARVHGHVMWINGSILYLQYSFLYSLTKWLNQFPHHFIYSFTFRPPRHFILYRSRLQKTHS